MQRYGVHEVGQADTHIAHALQTATLFAHLGATGAFVRWLSPEDPDDPATPLQHAQRICGRWLIVRQLYHGLTTKQILRQTGLDAQTWLLLTMGGVQASAVPLPILEHLAECLHDPTHDMELVAAVINVACGRSDDADGSIVERVMWDLEQEYTERAAE